MGSFVHKIDTWNLEAISCCKWESPFQIFTWHLTFDFLSHPNLWLICSISTKWDRFSNFPSQIIDIVVFICVICSGSYYRETVTAEWTDFVAMTGFWFSGVLLVFYLVHVIEKFHVIPWVTIELGFCGLWTFFYFTCALDLAVKASKGSVSAFAAASFFSFVAIGIYGFDAFLKFKAFKAGQLAQGERVVQQSESVTAYWKEKINPQDINLYLDGGQKSDQAYYLSKWYLWKEPRLFVHIVCLWGFLIVEWIMNCYHYIYNPPVKKWIRNLL